MLLKCSFIRISHLFNFNFRRLLTLSALRNTNSEIAWSDNSYNEKRIKYKWSKTKRNINKEIEEINPEEIRDYPFDLPDGGKQYFRFTYYPRFSNHKDPPYEPSPLHMVIRLRCLRKKPYWEKDVLKRFGLSDRKGDVAIVKNTPENNYLLYLVKHLVKITPIKLPNNFNLDAKPEHCFLKEDGELMYNPPVNSPSQEQWRTPKEDKKFWDTQLIKRDCTAKWENSWDLKL